MLCTLKWTDPTRSRFLVQNKSNIFLECWFRWTQKKVIPRNAIHTYKNYAKLRNRVHRFTRLHSTFSKHSPMLIFIEPTFVYQVNVQDWHSRHVERAAKFSRTFKSNSLRTNWKTILKCGITTKFVTTEIYSTLFDHRNFRREKK